MTPEEDDITMSEMFDHVIDQLEFFENITKPLCDVSVQERLNKAVKKCEQLVVMSNELELFSRNEDVEDLSTKDLKYLLLPAFLAYFKNKETTGDRLEIVKNCRTYNRHFLQLCKLYGLTVYALSPLDAEDGECKKISKIVSPPSLNDMTRTREEKIKRFKQKRQIESELAELKMSASGKNSDESKLREYYVKLLDKWIGDSIDNLEAIDQELQILSHMAKLSIDNLKQKVNNHPNAGDVKKFQSFIITRDSMQKKVFGLGYPSVPVFSVDEFYDQRVAAGLFPSPGNLPQNPPLNHDSENDETDKISKETAVEKDDADEIQRLRDWDEFRDDHRRGWGNTHNKG